MQLSAVEQKYFDYLDKIAISTLRAIGREVGVSSASTQNKDLIIRNITDICTGKLKPAKPSGRGAPVKDKIVPSEYLDGLKKIQAETAREESLSVAQEDLAAEQAVPASPRYSGILEVTANGFGFVRTNNCQPTVNGGDVFLSAPMIHSYRLRAGDHIVCTAHPQQKNNSPAIDKLLSVNGLPVGKYESRPTFDYLTAQYAKEKIALSREKSPLSLRILDLFAPIGKGQRALIIAPPKAGKTTLLKEIASSIGENHKEIKLIVLLIDERPEEVTDIRMSVKNAEIVYSTFDELPEHHVRSAALTIAHAKRMAEQGDDVVILLDSLTKLTRAYNNVTDSSGKTLSGGLEASALAEPKRFFGAARNTVEAGSLTILATALVDTGSRMDDVIYEEFKGTGNADIFLSRDLAERRIFPAIEIRRSGTRREELLLSPEELAAVYKMRERGLTENPAGVIDMLRRTQDNAEFVARLPEWMRVYKSM